MLLICEFIAFLWGMGPISPKLEPRLYGFGFWDVLIFLTLVAIFFFQSIRSSIYIEAGRKHWFFVVCVASFVGASLLSVLVNAFGLGSGYKDLLKAVRPLYYLVCILFIARTIAMYGVSRILTSFLAGILISGLANFIFVSSHNWVHVENLVVLYKSNVMGNLLGIGFALAGLLILEGGLFRSLLFSVSFLVLGVLTYSKGVWLMLLLSLPGLFAASGWMVIRTSGGSRRWRKTTILLMLIGIVAMAIVSPKIEQLVKFKLSTTQLGDTAQEGGTLAARWGFAIASVEIAKQHPLFGVGVSNFGAAYDSLKDFLGPSYWPTDNPHSALLYVLSCLGMPALLLYLCILAYPFQVLWKKLSFGGVRRLLVVGALAAVFLISAMTQVEILSQRFFWFFTAIAIGMRSSKPSGVRIPGKATGLPYRLGNEALSE